jgi:hypothetical protein
VFCLSPFCLSPFCLSQVDLFCLIPFCLSQRPQSKMQIQTISSQQIAARKQTDKCRNGYMEMNGSGHSSKWVGIEGGLPPFRLIKRDPPTLSSEANLSQIITKNVRKRAKIAKNAKSR